MTEQEAINTVMVKRRLLQISQTMEPASAERVIVEYTKDRDRSGLVENRVAWVITLASSQGLAKVHLDDNSGEVLEVIR